MSLYVQTHPTSSFAETAGNICESRGENGREQRAWPAVLRMMIARPRLACRSGDTLYSSIALLAAISRPCFSALAGEGFGAAKLFTGSKNTDHSEPNRSRKPSAAALRILARSRSVACQSRKGLSRKSRTFGSIPGASLPSSNTAWAQGSHALPLPAMIAAVSLDEGPMASSHIPLAAVPAKAAFDKPKRALGSLGEAAAASLHRLLAGLDLPRE